MHPPREIRLLLIVGVAVATGLVWLAVRRMRPESAQKLLPWSKASIWVFWLGWMALAFSGMTWDKHAGFLSGIGMMLYGIAIQARSWVKARAEFEELPPAFQRRIIKIPSKTYIEAKNLAAMQSWYLEKLGVRRLRAPYSGNDRIAFKFFESDRPLVLGPQDPTSTPQFPVLYSKKLDEAWNVLHARGVTVSSIEVDAGGTRYFSFQDTEGNSIEICSPS